MHPTSRRSPPSPPAPGPLAAALLCTWVLACGGASNSEVRGGLGVLTGGTDTSMLGTFRLADPSFETEGALRLLVLRMDRTFHAELIVSCASKPCAAVAIDGGYRQIRDLPNPSRANSISLYAQYTDPAAQQPVDYNLSLRRALVKNSPLVGLFHQDSPGDPAPYFELLHPEELWCASPDDCGQQGSTCQASCTANLCGCE